MKISYLPCHENIISFVACHYIATTDLRSNSAEKEIREVGFCFYIFDPKTSVKRTKDEFATKKASKFDLRVQAFVMKQAATHVARNLQNPEGVLPSMS